MFEVPSVSAVAAKLEDYMVGLERPTPADVAGLRRYFDLLDEIVEARNDLVESDLVKRLAKLPRREEGKTKG